MDDDDDVAAINRLVAAYCTALDAGDRAALQPMFAEGARFAGVGTDTEGPAAIVDYLAPAGRSAHEHTSRHVVGAAAVELDGGDGATSHTPFAALIVLSTGALLGAGTYRDRLARGPAGWQFTERIVTIEVPLSPVDPVPTWQEQPATGPPT